MSATPPLSPATTLRTLLEDSISRNYPKSPRSCAPPTQNGSIKRRLTTARLLALPRKPPYSVKTAATLDAVISSGVTGPARIMAEMRARGYEVERSVVLSAIRKWQTTAKTVERLTKNGLVAGKGLASKSVTCEFRPKDHHPDPRDREDELTRLLPPVCSEWPTLEERNDRGEDGIEDIVETSGDDGDMLTS